jgi:hypothetical protein
MLEAKIRARLQTARKQGLATETEILRVALGEIQTEASRRGADLSDADAEKILRKLVKSNSETLAATTNAERRAVLEAENAVLEELLPKMLGEDDVMAALEPVAEAVKAAGNDGQATGVAMKHLEGNGLAVDGKTVSAAVRRMRAG